MMKKLSFILLMCILMSVCVFALDSTEHTVNITYDETNSVVKAELAVSAGDAIVGHFGLSYNTEKLIAVDKSFSVLPAEIPEKSNDGKSFLTQVVSPLESYIVVTPESNKPSELINTSNGYILFGWYATKDVEAVVPSQDGGKIAEMYFKLKDGVSASDVSASDFAPVTADKCSSISGWNKGIIVINSENKVYTYKPSDGSAELKITVGSGQSETDSGDSASNTDAETEITEEKTEQDNEVSNPAFTENGEVKDSDLGLTVKTFSDKIRIFWSAPAETIPVEYRIKVADNNGNIIRSINGITGITKTLTVKNLAPDFELNISISAFISDGTELKHKEVVKAKTTVSTSAALSVYDITYNAGKGTLYGFDSEQVIFGEVPTKTPKIYAPDGYVFEGWTVDGENIVDLETYNVYESTEFTAKYVKN